MLRPGKQVFVRATAAMQAQSPRNASMVPGQFYHGQIQTVGLTVGKKTVRMEAILFGKFTITVPGALREDGTQATREEKFGYVQVQLSKSDKVLSFTQVARQLTTAAAAQDAIDAANAAHVDNTPLQG
jgi:hypothetical protein